MKLLALLSTALPLLAITVHAHAQQVWYFEFRAGANLPMDDLGNIELDVGAGLEATVVYEFSPTFAAYGGWGWHQFGAEAQNGDPDIEQTGYVLGLQYSSAFPTSGLEYRIRSGLTYEHIEIESGNDIIIFDGDHGIGFELGAALSYAVNENYTLTPGLLYRYLSSDMEFDNNTGDADLSYIALELGLL